MNTTFLYEYIRKHHLAAIATCAADGHPTSALVGIAVTERLEIIFDTVISSRKHLNLQNDPHVALVIGWDDETTIQYEGTATLLGDNDAAYKEIYYTAFPDGRQSAVTWSGLVHYKVSPCWIRYSNFNEPVQIEEMTF